jgi:hypothetical protein
LRSNRMKPSASSFDIWLLFAFAAAIMASLFFLPAILSRPWAWGAPVLVAVLMIRSSMRRRARLGWKWPGATGRDLARAALAVGTGGAFVFVMVSIMHGGVVPQLVLSLVVIIVFNVLWSLNVVTTTEAAFLEQCGPERRPPRPPANANDPTWKRTVRGIYQAIFLGVWLWGLAFFYVNGKVFDGGTLDPKGDRTVIMEEHGIVHYVTHEQKRLRDGLERGIMFGVPGAMALGLLVHFVLKVSLNADRR